MTLNKMTNIENECCTVCKKRVGMYGFNCKCGVKTCDKHRSAHECKFDYFTAHREQLAKNNPPVVVEKIVKI